RGGARNTTRNGRTRRWATGRRHRKPSCRNNRGMEIWKTLRVSHIPTPPTTTTDNCPTRRYTNIPLGTKDRSGHRQSQIVREVLEVPASLRRPVDYRGTTVADARTRSLGGVPFLNRGGQI